MRDNPPKVHINEGLKSGATYMDQKNNVRLELYQV